MRWVAWVVVVSACAKPGGGTLTPAPCVSTTTAVASPAAPTATAPQPAASASTLPVEALPALLSASAKVVAGNAAGDLKPKLCEVVLDGFTMLRPCTGAAGEKPTAASKSVGKGNCLVRVGDLEIVRPCEGKPNERKAPSSQSSPPPKMCEVVEGDIVRLAPCPKK